MSTKNYARSVHGKITVHQEFAKLSVSEGFFMPFS